MKILLIWAGLLCLISAAAWGTSPSHLMPSATAVRGDVLYISWGGYDRFLDFRTAFSAIDLPSGKVLWSIRGKSLLFAGEHLDSSNRISGFAHILLLNGALDQRWQTYAIDISRAGQVAWSSDSSYLALGGGFVVTEAGHVRDGLTGRIEWQMEPCHKALIDEGISEVLCLRKERERRRHPSKPPRCRLMLSRYQLADGSPLGSPRWLADCTNQPLVGIGSGKLLIGKKPHGLDSAFLVDLDGNEETSILPCQGTYQLHHSEAVILCRTVLGDTLRLNLRTGIHWLIEGYSIEPPEYPQVKLITEGRSPPGWSTRHGAPADYRPREGIVPLLKPGVLRKSDIRQSWAGSRDRAYVLAGDRRVVCIDRLRRKKLWSSSELAAPSSLRYSLIDSGNHGAMVLDDGLVLIFNPHNGKIQHRIYTSESHSQGSDRIPNRPEPSPSREDRLEERQ